MGILSATVVAAVIGWFYKKSKPKVQDFHEVIGQLGDPVLIEKKLIELLPQAKKLSNNTTYIQILSQIALFQAVQKKFEQAHQTLEQAQLACKADDYQGQACILLEKGRIFQHAGELEKAEKYFYQSYQLSSLHHLDYYTINAAHMIAIVVKNVEEKIKWNELALSLALQTENKKAQGLLAPLHNNLGQNYFDVQDYEKSLFYYEQASQLFSHDNRYSDFMLARWTIARCIRALNKLDQALVLQQELLSEIKNRQESKQYDMPEEMFFLVCGFVYEELAIIYNLENQNEKAKEYARIALIELENNEIFKTTSFKRIEFLKSLLFKNESLL